MDTLEKKTAGKMTRNISEISNYIVIDQGVRFGKPCIKGTRIAVGDILQWLSEGISVSEILDDYPLLKEEHIHAALAFRTT